MTRQTLDISAIILTKNEHLHIRRCLDNICPIAKQVFVVDCFSSDDTVDICREYANVAVFQHAWPGLYATQFNWALDHLPIQTTWVLRLDADEYLTDDLKTALREQLPHLPLEVTGLTFYLRRIFLNRHIRYGMPTVKLLRCFRFKTGRCEERNMDEHIALFKGSIQELPYEFADHNLNNLSWWIHKHVGYAEREAQDMLAIMDKTANMASITGQAADKRLKKYKYARLPLFWRSFAYFFYRYFLRVGFLDGKEGFLWHFFQGWWYRTLVDAKIYEFHKKNQPN